VLAATGLLDTAVGGVLGDMLVAAARHPARARTDAPSASTPKIFVMAVASPREKTQQRDLLC